MVYGNCNPPCVVKSNARRIAVTTHKAAHPFSCTPVASLESSCRRQVLHSLELEYPDEPQVRSLTELLFLTEKKKDREYLLGNTLGSFLTFKIGQLLLSLFFFFY
jgi:hypothetical protein